MSTIALVALLAGAVAEPPAVASPTSAPGTSTPAVLPASTPPAPSRRWYVLPNAAFDTDDGLGFGARGELALVEPGYHPYRTAFVVHAFATLRGFHHHRFRFDRVGLGPGRRVRLTLHLAWRQWLNDGYWGIGNGTGVERAYKESFGDDDPRRKRYRYSLYQPFTHLAVRVALGRGWALFGAFSPKVSVVRTYPGSLLEEQRPFGMEGGLALPFSCGVLYDTRSPEADPQRGLFAEAGGRVSGQVNGSRGVFGGLHATVRAYHQLTPWIVVAGRAIGEILLGDIPYYEMVQWGGSIPVAGFGGSETLRGIPFGRWHGPGKAVLNLEARFRLFAHTIFRRPLYWQLGLFADSGLVFASGDRATAPGPRWPIHVSGGGGIRAVFQETFVARLDTGVGLDTVREPDGRESYTPSFGLYVVFDQAF